MKNLNCVRLLFIVAALLILSCGQIVDNNPTGSTGGGENGYGFLNGMSEDYTDPEPPPEYSLIGEWRYDYPDPYHGYETATFHNNGFLEIYLYDGVDEYYVTGSWAITGSNQLTFYLEGLEFDVIYYFLDSNTLSLTLVDEGITTTYYRVSLSTNKTNLDARHEYLAQPVIDYNSSSAGLMRERKGGFSGIISEVAQANKFMGDIVH